MYKNILITEYNISLKTSMLANLASFLSEMLNVCISMTCVSFLSDSTYNTSPIVSILSLSISCLAMTQSAKCGSSKPLDKHALF